MKMAQAERQRKAVETIREAGGDVHYDYKCDSGRVAFHVPPPTPAWLRGIFGEDFFADVAHVGLDDHIGTDDMVLEHVARLASLNLLNLSGPEFTDASLEHVKRLAKLQYLTIFDSEVTDAGLKHLRGLTNLEWLVLSGPEFTDAGLEHLESSNLRTLWLFDTNVTAKGIEELQEALPNCAVHTKPP